MMTAQDTKPRAWVGCLACYNAGRLVGEWVEGIDALSAKPACGYYDEAHEELWVFDHEGYHGAIKGECSPDEAQRVAQAIDDLDANGYPPEAFGAWTAHGHGAVDDRERFEDAYCGEWGSFREFAEQLAEDIGAIDPNAGWPHACIDWEHAARELSMDYVDLDAPGGLVYVFRNH